MVQAIGRLCLGVCVCVFRSKMDKGSIAQHNINDEISVLCSFFKSHWIFAISLHASESKRIDAPE